MYENNKGNVNVASLSLRKVILISILLYSNQIYKFTPFFRTDSLR